MSRMTAHVMGVVAATRKRSYMLHCRAHWMKPACTGREEAVPAPVHIDSTDTGHWMLKSRMNDMTGTRTRWYVRSLPRSKRTATVASPTLQVGHHDPHQGHQQVSLVRDDVLVGIPNAQRIETPAAVSTTTTTATLTHHASRTSSSTRPWRATP